MIWQLLKIYSTAERALSFRGPAIICGDLNAPLDKFPAWAKLQQFGWADSALLDQRIHDREPQPTSKGTVRHSFILCCGEMASSFLTCRTACEYEFDAHPLLVTGFSISTLCTPSWKWVLPKALDKFIFNEAEIDAYGDNFCRLNAAKFQDAIHNMDMETAAKIFTHGVESTLKHSAISSEGTYQYIQPGHFGRWVKTPLKLRLENVPVIRPARNGEFTPIVSQLTFSLRYRTKQLRRIKALSQQYSSFLKNKQETTLRACRKLWNCILQANGFCNGFHTWIGKHLGLFVPLSLPSLEYIWELEREFDAFHSAEIQKYYASKNAANKKSTADDIQGGGHRAFASVRDAPAPPLTSVTKIARYQMRRVKWTKEGRNWLPMVSTQGISREYPITFQGQKRSISRIQPQGILLESPVALKDCKDLEITQPVTSAHPELMRQCLIAEWSKLWKRDPCHEPANYWDDFCRTAYPVFHTSVDLYI